VYLEVYLLDKMEQIDRKLSVNSWNIIPYYFKTLMKVCFQMDSSLNTFSSLKMIGSRCLMGVPTLGHLYSVRVFSRNRELLTFLS